MNRQKLSVNTMIKKATTILPLWLGLALFVVHIVVK